MSDLARRNTEMMIAEARRMHTEVEELREMIKAQNLKITTLTNELAEVKKAQVIGSIQIQAALTGNGGTT
jgi:uncharacterized coiled-coil DUF342 family protein